MALMESSRGIDYVFGYYDGMNPNRAGFTLANRGYLAPKIGNACELGFGQGLSLAINAASSSRSWVGTDIEPAQVSFARGLVSHLDQGKCSIYGESFREFSDNQDIGQFDFLCLHGIWTWIKDNDRQTICDLIDKKLKPGGLLYISYNALPAWAGFMPIQKLFNSYCAHNKSMNLDSITNLTDSFKFAEKLLETNPKILRAIPSLGTQLEKMKTRDQRYLVHEYLAADFTPMTFDTVANWLSPLNMTYISSSNFLHDLAAINLTNEQQEFLAKIKNDVFRETCRDLMVHRDFRQEYWIKGPIRLSNYQREKTLSNYRLLLTSAPKDIKYQVTGALGTAELEEAIYDPLIKYLADHEDRSYKEVTEHLNKIGIDKDRVEQAIEILFTMGHLHVLSSGDGSPGINSDVEELNRKIMENAYNATDIGWMASSVIEGGIEVSKFNQLHLRSIKAGYSSVSDLASAGMDFLGAMGQKIIQDKEKLESEEQNRDYLTKHAEEFLKYGVPIFKSLKILD